jgi:hypothetical protein
MVRSASQWLLLGGVAALVFAACSSDGGGDGKPPATTPTGGTGTGGAGTGGALTTGGTTGGTVTVTGGVANPTGGAGGKATGGGPAAGGTPAGGMGGAPATGGAPIAGGGSIGGGGSPAGGAGGGAGGEAPATLKGEIDRGNKSYVLEFGDLYFGVSSDGGRILDVHLSGGKNILTGPEVNDVNYGSTFWPSPQSWEWPPTSSIPEINNGPYTAMVASPSFTLTGAANATVGASVTKKFTADLSKGSVDVEYKMTATAAGKSFAPWEISRVPQTGGLSFYPTGTGAPTSGTFAAVPTTTGAGCTWYQAAAARPSADQKLFADGSGGWLAHVQGDLLLLKKFPDLPSGMAATGENEIEIYVSSAANYIELEQQGAYMAVAMGQSLTWNVTWIVRKLPAGMTATPGNQALVDYVKSLVQ